MTDLIPTSMPWRILVSERIARAHAAQVADAMRDMPYMLVHADNLAGEDVPQVDAAFFSRDIYGASSKNEASPAARAFFDALQRQSALRWLHVFSAGVDRPIYRSLRERGVRITTSSGATSQTVAHSALCGILALARRLPDWIDAQRRKSWEPMRGERAPQDLAGQTAVVVGMGRVGTEVARLLNAFGVRVTGVQRAPSANAYCERVVTSTDLPAVLPSADWVILSCPLTQETSRLFDAGMLARIKRGARLVNVARGEVAVEADLIAALESGHLGGAYLDVFEREPLGTDSPLWSLPNVIVSAHTAADSAGYEARVVQLFMDNLRLIRDGKPLLNEAWPDQNN